MTTAASTATARRRAARRSRRSRALARERGIWLIGGSIPELEDGNVYNTSFVYAPDGSCAARHRKTHLFDIDVAGGQRFMESETLTPGSDITTFETPWGTMGLCICFDFRFEELARLMTLRGARVLFVPAAFNMTTGPAHWELLFRQRAVDNQVFTVGTSPARDESASYHAWGHSIVCDPWGSIDFRLRRGGNGRRDGAGFRENRRRSPSAADPVGTSYRSLSDFSKITSCAAPPPVLNCLVKKITIHGITEKGRCL